MRKTFIKRYVVERTKETKIRPEEQSEKTKSCQENLWKKYSLKGHKDRNTYKYRVKRSGQAQLVYIM